MHTKSGGCGGRRNRNITHAYGENIQYTHSGLKSGGSGGRRNRNITHTYEKWW